MPVGADSRVHTTFGHNPSSLRLCSFDPNLQNIPRGGEEFTNYVKETFICPPGYTFWERDFSGIEAVLVGYFAGSRNYTRLAKTDVHSFYTAYCLNALDPGKVGGNDLPDLSWDDTRLRLHLADIKSNFKRDRNDLYKHLVHGANYLQTPNGAKEYIFKTTGKVYDTRLISRVMSIYFELFPEIRRWHQDLCKRVDGTKQRHHDPSVKADPFTYGVCYVRNPFGYVHHFYDVLKWTKADGKWYSEFGEDAKRLVSFLPQSTAAAIIKQAAKRIWVEHAAVGESLRLLIHDSILGEVIQSGLDICLATSKQVMELPIEELPLDPSWNMGQFLTIGTEAKVGPCWGTMKEVKD